MAPRSVAIVGLSADPTKHGRRVLDNLVRLGFDGELWGVNPGRPEVDGVEIVGTLRESPIAPDVVVSAVPAEMVPDVVREAAAIGAGTVIVFAGGFVEAGGPGASLQDELRASASHDGVRILGPNSGGVIVAGASVALSFLTCLDRPVDQIRTGPVGIVTQSGGTGSYLHNLAAACGGGLAASVSTGNEVDIDVADGIIALCELHEVRSIGVVLETVRNGPKFMAAVRVAIATGRPVVALPIGRSDRGRQLMRTHTGALARPTRVLDGVLDALGVTTAETPQELLDMCEVVARSERPAGRRVGIVTHSGGVAIMLSDLAAEVGLDLPVLGDDLRKGLVPLIQQGALDNPLDMGGIIGGPHRFGEVVDAFCRSGDFDAVLAVSSAHPRAHAHERATSLLALEPTVPVVHLWMGGDIGIEGLVALRDAGAPVVEEPRAAIRAMSALTTWAGTSPVDAGAAAPGSVRLDVADVRTEYDAKQVVYSWGIEVPAGELALTAEQAGDIGDRVGYPCVVKIVSPDIAHKSEIGGVVVDVADRKRVEEAYARVLDAARTSSPGSAVEGVLVERQRSGPEVIVGAVRDATFGPMVLVGIGGVAAEALDDVRMAPAPLSSAHARRMIDQLVGLRLLTEPRRGAPADIGALGDLLVTIGDRIVAVPTIRSIDLNPVVWSPPHWVAVDALIDTDDDVGIDA